MDGKQKTWPVNKFKKSYQYGNLENLKTIMAWLRQPIIMKVYFAFKTCFFFLGTVIQNDGIL